jgi:hypothetical protein
MKRRLMIAALAALTSARPAAGQSAALRHADSLLRAGMLERAESVYYAEARHRPRDPEARAGLGLFLLSRGAVKIGATLLEEAIRFGGDPAVLGPPLASAYAYLNDWRSTAMLAESPLHDGQKKRNSWLLQHPTRVIAPDSTVLMALARTPLDSFIGVTPIRLNGTTVKALIRPALHCKIELSDTSHALAKLHTFPDTRTRGGLPYLAAAADSVGLGRMTILGVPIDVRPLGPDVGATICFGELMPFSPTFDARAGLLALHVSALPAPPRTVTTVPFYAPEGRLSLIRAGGLASIVSPAVRSFLGDSRWTIDTRRGQVVIEPQRP